MEGRYTSVYEDVFRGVPAPDFTPRGAARGLLHRWNDSFQGASKHVYIRWRYAASINRGHPPALSALSRSHSRNPHRGPALKSWLSRARTAAAILTTQGSKFTVFGFLRAGGDALPASAPDRTDNCVRTRKAQEPIMPAHVRSILEDAPSHIRDISDSWKRERPDLDSSDFLLAIYAMRLGRVLDDAYDRMCRKQFGISGADMRVVFALRRAGRPYARRPTDLYRALLVTSGAITKQVDRLFKLGFVQRLDDPSHAAGSLIQLTAKGLKVANAAADTLASNSPLAPGTRGLSTAERAAGRRFIEEVLLALEADELNGRRQQRQLMGKRRRHKAA